jgi:hypothetical protein
MYEIAGLIYCFTAAFNSDILMKIILQDKIVVFLYFM